MPREWTHDQLNTYVSRFTDIQKDTVLKKIMESKLLDEFLSTTHGRLILDSVVDLITQNTMSIVSTSTSSDGLGDAELKKIVHLSHEISTAYVFMHSLARMSAEGREHIEKMKR